METKYERTIFNSCFAMLLYYPASFILKLCGWKVDNDISQSFRKYIMVAAPHTSNWDFFYGMLFVFKIRLRNFRAIGKDSLTNNPLGFIAKWLGILPIDRSKSQNTVTKIAMMMKDFDDIVIAIAPEGTRKKVNTWKTGFYHIAQEANIPILLAYIDRKKKLIGFIKEFVPTGNIETDIANIRNIYTDKIGIR
ncbi:MAG: 1-acyl-sn-glycerol-3-phosphate acyltransferase [Deltaproteobacteria bacterium]